MKSSAPVSHGFLVPAQFINLQIFFLRKKIFFLWILSTSTIHKSPDFFSKTAWDFC